MPIANLDVMEKKREEILQKFNEAVQKGDEKAFSEAFGDMLQTVQENILEQYQEAVRQSDAAILAARGARQLTSAEHAYYQKIIEAMKSENPKQAIENLDVVMPETIIDSVFDDLRTEHPLLEKINFLSLPALTRIMMNTNGYQRALWGKLTATITEELTSGFKEVDVTQNKLTAFLPISKSMLDLGPTWLDSYVRQVLAEALANGMEYGIIMGTGKDMPIGMVRQVGDGVSVKGGEYPMKNAVKITRFDDVQLGAQAAILAINEKGQARAVRGLIMLVNPSDYFSKVLPAIQRPAPGGGYVSTLPFAIDVMQSAEVPVGKAVFGMGGLYFLGGGTGKSGKVEYSDHYRYLEDERVYTVKGYAHGFPKDNNAFLLFDITGLKPSYYRVEVVDGETAVVEDATLADLRVSNNALNEEFSPETTTYTVTTKDASNSVTAVASSASATMEIKHKDKVVSNGSRITWDEGANTVTIKVNDGSQEKAYTLTVTKASE